MGLTAAVQDSGSGFSLIFMCQQSQSRLCYFAVGHLASLYSLSGSGKCPGDQNHKHIRERQQEGAAAAFQPISCFTSTFLLCRRWTLQFVLEAASLSAVISLPLLALPVQDLVQTWELTLDQNCDLVSFVTQFASRPELCR